MPKRKKPKRTPREIKILRKAMQGKTAREIAKHKTGKPKIASEPTVHHKLRKMMKEYKNWPRIVETLRQAKKLSERKTKIARRLLRKKPMNMEQIANELGISPTTVGEERNRLIDIFKEDYPKIAEKLRQTKRHLKDKTKRKMDEIESEITRKYHNKPEKARKELERVKEKLDNPDLSPEEKNVLIFERNLLEHFANS